MKIEFASVPLPETGCAVVLCTKDGTLGAAAADLDRRTDGTLKRAMELAGNKLKQGDVVDLVCPAGLALDHVVVLSLGDPQDTSRYDLESVGGKLASKLKSLRIGEANLVPEALPGLSMAPAEMAVSLAAGARLRGYRFDKYRSHRDVEDNDAEDELGKLVFRLAEPSAAQALWAPVEAVIAGVEHGRDLVSEPANVLSPSVFADECRKLGGMGLEVEIFDPSALERLGMKALLAVGQGSVHGAHVAVIQWRGGPTDQPPVALVGKGVCFDSGGLSLKPAGGMEDMKWDMGGAGAVFGAMKALAGRQARANVVGVLGLTENMPSGEAQRPGDVITSMAGVTIEVVNTDAEGRLVLADILHYTQERFQPKAMIDLATLTGAIIVALGHEQAGLFTPDDGLAEKIVAAGEAVGEKVWRMPLGKNYAKHIKSDIADIKNVGRAREAGATAGAVFLERFIGDTPWAHLDIAGVTWSKRDLALAGKGATGFGIRLLDRLIADNYES